MRVSIIMPVYNAASTLPQCLVALRSEMVQEKDCEIICVDNCSTDGSAEIVAAFPEATLMHEPRPGAYAARNRGAAIAQGELLVFTDPDCVVEQGWLLAAKEAFRDSTCLVALGVRRPAPDMGLNRLLGDYETAKDSWVLGSNEPTKYYGFTNNMAVLRSAWDRHGPFDDRPRGGDTIFIRRLVDLEGCGAVKFTRGMRISHLEINGPLTYIKKTFIYGRSMQSYSQSVPSKPLSFRDRLQVYWKASRDNGYGFFRFAALGIFLIAGIAAWSLGRFTARVQFGIVRRFQVGAL